MSQAAAPKHDRFVQQVFDYGIFGEVMQLTNSIETRRRLAIFVYLEFVFLATFILLYLVLMTGNIAVGLVFFALSSVGYLALSLLRLPTILLGLLVSCCFIGYYIYAMLQADVPERILPVAIAIAGWVFLVHGYRIGLTLTSIMATTTVGAFYLADLGNGGSIRTGQDAYILLLGGTLNVAALATSIFTTQFVVSRSMKEMYARNVDGGEALRDVASTLTDIDYGVLIVDKSGIIQFINGAALYLLDATKTQMYYQPVVGSFLVQDPEGAMVKGAGHPVMTAMSLARPYHFSPQQMRVIDGAGKVVPLRVAITPIIKNKTVLGATVVLRMDQHQLATAKT